MEHGILDTEATHQLAVERVIQAMHTRLPAPLPLEEMAALAGLSPYHFSRVFRRVTGIPPGEFLSGLRLDAARQLLVTTSLAVTEICYEVGYNSPGTFTTRFTDHFGLSPRHLRQFANRFVPPTTQLECGGEFTLSVTLPRYPCLRGQIIAPDPAPRRIFVGLFPRPIPQLRPIGCTLLHAPGPYEIPPVPDGCYYLLSAALPLSDDPQPLLVPGRDLLVGNVGPLVRHNGGWSGPVDVLLRPPRLTDPPRLIFLPALLRSSQ